MRDALRSGFPNVEDWRWDDVRVVLLLARLRQVTAAARSLRVDPATVSRRLRSIETALGTPLFVRTGRTLSITERGEALLPTFEAVERSMNAVFEEAERYDRAEDGVVRVTTPPMMSEYLLVPRLAKLRQRAPSITLELDSAARVMDLAGREFDIALRLVPSRGAGLIGRRVGAMRMIVAGSPALRKRLGVVGDWGDVPWIGSPSDSRDFVRDRARTYVLRASSAQIQTAAALAGLGAMVITAVLAAELGLVPLDLAPALRAEVAAQPTTPVWAVTRQAIRRSARIRVVWDWLLDCARELSD